MSSVIPDFQTTMRPLLTVIEDGAEHHFADALEQVCDLFALTEEQRRELLPSGAQSIIKNRVSWARTYMKKAGLVEAPRGRVQITQRGRQALSDCPERINIRYLMTFPEFVEFQNKGRQPPSEQEEQTPEEKTTPEEQINTAYLSLRKALAADLLEQIHKQTPVFFE